MPCDTYYLQEQARKEREAALAELQKQIAQGKVRLKKNPKTGEVTIEKFEATLAYKSGWHESCVLAATLTRGSWVAKQKLQAMLKSMGVTAEQVIAAHGHSHGH